MSETYDVWTHGNLGTPISCAGSCPMSYYGDGSWRCAEKGWPLEGCVPDWCQIRRGPLTIELDHGNDPDAEK